jgi:hypothetical protein
MDKDIELEKIHMVSNIKRLYTDSVTDKDKELMIDYINNLSEKELEVFKGVYHDVKYTRNKNNITHNSIRLTLRLYKDLEIKTFPHIRKIACKGWSIGNGTFAFSMCLLEEENKHVYSYATVNLLLAKKNTIVTGLDYSNIRYDTVIDIK